MGTELRGCLAPQCRPPHFSGRTSLPHSPPAALGRGTVEAAGQNHFISLSESLVHSSGKEAHSLETGSQRAEPESQPG